jgi:D-galactarolactone cycloisomerase
MRISRVSAYPLKLAGDEAYLGTPPPSASDSQYFVRPPWRSIYSARFETLLVRIETDDGYVGWGESLAPVAPEVPGLIVDRLLAPVLLGEDPRSVRVLFDKLRELMRERGHLAGHQADALAAVDIALWDLRGRALGLPVFELLGGAFRLDVPAYVSGLPRPDDAERASLAASWAAQGATGIKLALGYGIDNDLRTFDAVQSAAPEVRLAVDAHWAYTLPEARRLAFELGRRKAWFLEAPLAPEDVLGHRDLVTSGTVSIAIGETLRNRYEFADWLGHRALTLAQPDVARTGITEALNIATLCSSAHVPVALHHSVGLGIALAAGLHVAAAIDNLAAFEYQPQTVPMANAILSAPLKNDAAGFVVPLGAGLGIDVDFETVVAAAEDCGSTLSRRRPGEEA